MQDRVQRTQFFRPSIHIRRTDPDTVKTLKNLCPSVPHLWPFSAFLFWLLRAPSVCALDLLLDHFAPASAVLFSPINFNSAFCGSANFSVPSCISVSSIFL